MKTITLLAALLLIFQTVPSAAQSIDKTPKTKPSKSAKKMTHSIYDYKVKDISGNDFDFATLKGKKIMIVNTASKCGLTPQYEQLQQLYKEYGADRFVIIGFPSNDFAGQEPGNEKEIASFCKMNYGVTFPMMSKIQVTGRDMAQIYQFLTRKELNGYQDSKVEWNFQKYLIDENGHLVKVISPQTTPKDDVIVNWIKS